jgi:addiction module toxin, RelE/StbE family
VFDLKNTKYHVQYTSRFKKEYKKVIKQGKNKEKFLEVLNKIANGEELETKYRNHKLINNNIFKDCYECHISPDWLLVYIVQDGKLVLVLFTTGSHSDLFNM